MDAECGRRTQEGLPTITTARGFSQLRKGTGPTANGESTCMGVLVTGGENLKTKEEKEGPVKVVGCPGCGGPLGGVGGGGKSIGVPQAKSSVGGRRNFGRGIKSSGRQRGGGGRWRTRRGVPEGIPPAGVCAVKTRQLKKTGKEDNKKLSRRKAKSVTGGAETHAQTRPDPHTVDNRKTCVLVKEKRPGRSVRMKWLTGEEGRTAGKREGPALGFGINATKITLPANTRSHGRG